MHQQGVTKMGKAEREGWNTWNRYLEAGVVENTLLWTDDPIMVDNTIGRIANKLGKCWPIDAAVAYTLATHGENAALTWKDMVNQNTRMAAVMMTGKVAYGNLPNPVAESCGHDEVIVTECCVPRPRLDKVGGVIDWEAYAPITDMVGYDELPEHIKKLCVFRVEGHDLTDRRLGLLKYLSRPECAPLLAWITVALGCDEFKVHIDRVTTYMCTTKGFRASLINSTSKGQCGFDKDNPNYGSCAHHDDITKKDWYMIKEDNETDTMRSIWYRGKGRVVHSNWNHDQFARRNITHYNTPISRIVPFNRVKRSLAQSIPEDVVIQEIRKSLQRMRSWDGRRLVSKTGIGKKATHTWYDWSWLVEMASWIQDTHSKNRKENDTACQTCYSAGEVDEAENSVCRCGDGWKYVKYKTNRSYGHEIAKFEWQPIVDQKVYVLIGSQNNELPWLFNTKEQAAQVRGFIPQLLTKMPIGSVTKKDRVWDLSTGADVISDVNGSNIGLRLRSRAVDMSMKWDEDPENLPTAVQLKNMLVFGNPSQVNEAVKLCKNPRIVSTGLTYVDNTIKVEELKTMSSGDNIMESV